MTQSTDRRILVVEDVINLRDHICETLSDLEGGATVDAAGDGVEALEMIEQAEVDYDLLICDIGMPRMDGESLLQELRRREYSASVLMLTAFGQDDIIIRCLRAGACDYLIKPVGIDDLLASVTTALQYHPTLAMPIEVEFNPDGWFEISSESDYSSLYKFRKFLSLLDNFRIPEPAGSEIRLALEELGRNAIEWGNKFDRGKKVTFGCRILPYKVMVYIQDEGEGFQLEAVPDPSADPIAHIQHRQELGKRMGGYGIHLVRNMMDKLVFNAKGNRVVAIRYLDRFE